jgi:hypothetical protein
MATRDLHHGTPPGTADQHSHDAADQRDRDGDPHRWWWWRNADEDDDDATGRYRRLQCRPDRPDGNARCGGPAAVAGAPAVGASTRALSTDGSAG